MIHAGLGLELVVFVDFLSCTGLAAYTIAVYVRVAAAVLVNYSLEYLAHLRGGLLGDDLALYAGLGGLYDVSVGIEHFVHYVRSYQVAAVDDGAQSGGHLERSYLVGLTEA